MDRSRIASLALVATLAGCASLDRDTAPARRAGFQMPFGQGTAATYAEVDAAGRPVAIGIALSPPALEGLPAGSDMHHCTGRAADGSVAAQTRCIATFEHALPLPDDVAARADMPFKWVLLNWNPRGHIPPGIYDLPHFDVHFTIAPIAEIFAIQAGDCGPEGVRCDQFARGKKAVPANYVPADFRDVDAVVPAMGNHLIDVSGEEFHGHAFGRSFIYGVYDGRVTFYEQMVTRAYLLAKPDGCMPIKLPRAYAVAGYYPTTTCTRHDPRTGNFLISMEGFVLRDASPPEGIAAK
jgi:hypothetical protein